MKADASLCDGQGACAYGSSCIFYAAVFEDLLADAAFQRKPHRAMADLVDGRTQHRLTGVEPCLLHGSSREGGFGLLPVTDHVHACHAHGFVAHFASPFSKRRQWK
jgi:hypothetical protein